MTHTGPGGMRRPLINCQPQVAFEVDQSLRGEEKSNLENTLSSSTGVSVSVEEGISVDEGGSTDIIFSPGDTSVDNETFAELMSAIRVEGYEISGWRIGNV